MLLGTCALESLPPYLFFIPNFFKKKKKQSFPLASLDSFCLMLPAAFSVVNMGSFLSSPSPHHCWLPVSQTSRIDSLSTLCNCPLPLLFGLLLSYPCSLWVGNSLALLLMVMIPMVNLRWFVLHGRWFLDRIKR